MPLDLAGNTLGDARVLNATSGFQTFADRVDASDATDYYRFSLTSRSNLSLTLNSLSADANLQLLNSSGTVMQASTNGAGLAEAIGSELEAGTYYIRVYSGSAGAATDYTLGFTTQSELRQPDILWRDYSSGKTVIWYTDGTSNVAINSWIELAPVATNWTAEAVADFNGDNRSDIVWRDYTSGKTVVWFMDGEHNAALMSYAELTPAAANWTLEAVTDFNSDSRPDLIWHDYSNGKTVIWFMGGANNTTIASFAELAPVATNLTLAGVADFNNDSRPDIVWRDRSNGNNTVWFMGGTNNTTLTAYASLTAVAPGWTLEGVTDFDNDSRPDLLWRDYASGKTVVWFMGGTNNTTLTAWKELLTVAPSWRPLSYQFRETPPLPDTAGNLFSTAFNLGNLSGNGSFKDRVAPSDVNDYYQFTLGSLSNFSLTLNGLSANADAQLFAQNGSLISGSYSRGTNAEALSRSLSPGTYYLRIYAVGEAATSYSLGIAATPTVADLKGVFFDAAPEPLTAGSSFTANFRVQNASSVSAGGFRVGFYLSGDSTISTSDRLLGYYDITSLAANSTTNTLSTRLLLPGSADAFWNGNQTYHIGMVVDALNAVTETDKTNNANRGNGIDWDDVAITVPLADLRGAFFDTAENLTAGNSFTANFRIRNTGNGDAGAFQVGFYLSSDSTITSSDRLLGYKEISFLAAGGTSATLSQNLMLPGLTDSFWNGNGTYYIGMIVDALSAIRETSETNNTNLGNGNDWDDVAITVTPIITDPAIATIATTGTLEIDALLVASPYNKYWNTSANGGYITYSFYSNSSGAYYGSETVSEVSSAVKTNVRNILALLESYINIKFVEVADSASSYGVLRYMYSSGPSYAYAYYPTTNRVGGDVHLNQYYESDSYNQFSGGLGTHGYMTLIHETFHALGIKHPGNYNGSGTGEAPFLSGEEDNTTNTVMSYNFAGEAAVTPMPYDIRALQYLYGARSSYANSNTYAFSTVYGYSNGGRFFGSSTTELKQTIWDSGGVDTLDFSGLLAANSYRFDLREGGMLTTQAAYNSTDYVATGEWGTYYTTGFGTAIAYGTAIENLVNSRGNDYIIANSANNLFRGYTAGISTGNDVLEGSNALDVLELSGYSLTNLTTAISGQDLTIRFGSNGSVQIKSYYDANSSTSNAIKMLIGGSYYTYSMTAGWQAAMAPNLPNFQEPVFSNGLTATTPSPSDSTADSPVVACACPVCTAKQGLTLLGSASLLESVQAV